MRPHSIRILTVALVLVLCQGATRQSQSTLVRDGKGPPAIAKIESGGHRVTPSQSPAIPYSLIGALNNDNHCYPGYTAWPWRMLRSFSLHHRMRPGRPHVLSVADFPRGLPLLP
jgi:hypothetical protein